ncbi:MAG: substrate-binding periplasmic protein [Dongiaceae bacterium]
MKKIFFLLLIPMLALSSCGEKKAESTLARVQESKTMRCGYIIYEPYLKRDINTGKMSGIVVEYLEQAAAREGIKIEWAQEVNIDQIVPALDGKRIDMWCVPASYHPDYAKVLDFVGDFGKLPYYTYVPYDSKITQAELQNDPNARFVVMDAFIPQVLTPRYYPNAKVASFPQSISIGELFDQLKYGKADAIVNEHVGAKNYMRNNPNTIRRLNDTPLESLNMSFVVRKDDKDWGQFIGHLTDTKRPENQAIFKALTEKYGLVEGALVF